MATYSRNFYSRREARVAQSAAALVPQIVSMLQPRSVVDIGCANGIWLEAFASQTGARVHGIDGPWVPRDKLRIAADCFSEFDFSRAATPFHPPLRDRRFDLLISFELLEHLPEDRAEAMVDMMCSLSDVLLVSAAAPHQGGTGHVNEQWPDYWAARFRERGFIACDFLRPAIWTDERIAPWYRQNLIGYFRHEVPPSIHRAAVANAASLVDRPLPLCHPGVFSYKLGKMRRWLRNPFAMAIGELRRRRS